MELIRQRYGQARSLSHGNRMHFRSSRGFTLIELLVTLAIILIMASILMSRGSRSYQSKQLAACSKNLQTIYVAMSFYANDHNGVYPLVPKAETSEEPLSLLIPKCTTVTEIFTCPGSKDDKLPEGTGFAKNKISYCYYMGWKKEAGANAPLLSDRQVDSARKKQGQLVFSADGKTAGDNHTKYGGNILFGDGQTFTMGAKTERDLLYPTNIIFLNPRR